MYTDTVVCGFVSFSVVVFLFFPPALRPYHVYMSNLDEAYGPLKLPRDAEVSIFHASFHDGRAGGKGRVLACPSDCCPKLLQIAEAVASEAMKAVIMRLAVLACISSRVTTLIHVEAGLK